MTAPTLEGVIDAIVRVDKKLDIKFISEPGLSWFGFSSLSNAPKQFINILHPDDLEVFQSVSTSNPRTFVCDVRVLKGGKEVWVNIRGYQLPLVHQYMMCIIDISSWKTDDSVLRHAADHDDLTGLPNRAFLKRQIENLIQDQKASFSVALLDLDGFKKVNDTYGHAVGDEVLIETTRRLAKILGSDDALVRLGGDEFVLICKGIDTTEINNKLNKVLLSIARPYETAPHNAYLGVSIGIAKYPEHGADYSTILKNADTAMYHSKNGGKNRISIFTKEKENIDFSITSAIHKGIQDGEFYLEYQPQFDVDRNLIGAEALMRWSSQAFGRMAPDVFIPIVEDTGLMPFLGKWALRCACHQLKQLQELNPGFVMSVNVSPIQFSSDNFDTQVLEAISEACVDPSKVILEITESTLMHSHEKTERALNNLRKKGVRFSIDDFGTGFSSLAYLTRLPVSSIKIDKTFIRAIEVPTAASESDKRLITAMINLAHGIELKVVAEGVENEEQLSFLKSSGCNLIQGYLLGKPLSVEAMTALLSTQTKAIS